MQAYYYSLLVSVDFKHLRRIIGDFLRWSAATPLEHTLSAVLLCSAKFATHRAIAETAGPSKIKLYSAKNHPAPSSIEKYG